jgi:hypothetical protein
MVNLRGENPHWRWWRSEKKVCAELGVAHLDVRLSSKNIPTPSMLTGLLDAFDAAARPLLLKCSGGQDRTSFASALYLVHARGWETFSDAQAQFAGWPYLHWPRDNQRWLRLFLVHAQEDAHNRSLRQWIANGYSQEKFRDWLVARGLAGAFRSFHD